MLVSIAVLVSLIALASPQELLRAEIAAGRCPSLGLPTTIVPGEPPDPVPLCDAEALLIAALDEQGPQADALLQVGELLYAHGYLAGARERFLALAMKFPKHEAARKAIDHIVNIYLSESDWAAIEKFSIENLPATREPLPRQHERIRFGSRFRMADDLMKKGQFQAAADKYLDLVAEGPDHEFADRALNNAAVCLENLRRFDEALHVYERITREYPHSSLASASTFRVAVNAENSFDFERALAAYAKLASDYPQSRDRADALFNRARLLEGLQRHDEAATAYLKYADAYPEQDDAAKCVARAARLRQRAGDDTGAAALLRRFLRETINDPSSIDLRIDAARQLGDVLARTNKMPEALAAYRMAAETYDGLTPKPRAAWVVDSAAAARFQLAMSERRVDWRSSARFVTELDRVVAYGDVNWMIAALCAQADQLERFPEGKQQALDRWSRILELSEQLPHAVDCVQRARDSFERLRGKLKSPSP